MRASIKLWNQYWFRPAPPLALGLCRFLFFATLFVRQFNKDLSYFNEVSSVFWLPVAPYRFFSVPPFEFFHWLPHAHVIWKLAIFASALGLFTRVSTIVTALLGIILIGLEQSFADTSHSAYLTLCLLLVFAFSKCGDGFSLDQLVKLSVSDQSSKEYFWPIQLARTLHALVYFASGVAKLRHGGVAWIFSDNLSILLKQCYVLMPYKSSLTWWVSEHVLICQFLAFAAVALELTFPIVLFNQRSKRFFLPAVLGLHTGIYFLMGIRFWVFLELFIFWIPLNLLSSVGRRLGNYPRSKLSLGKNTDAPLFGTSGMKTGGSLKHLSISTQH